MNNDTVGYDLLCKVFGEFFKQMRREPNLLMLTDEQLDQLREKDWDELRGPVLNHIEEALEAYSE